MQSPYFVVQVSDCFGNGCLADLAFMQALQKSGFDSLSNSILVMYPFDMACLIVTGDMYMTKFSMCFVYVHFSVAAFVR